MGREPDSPAGEHPDEPDMIRISDQVQNSQTGDHNHVSGEVDEESPEGRIVAHVMGSPSRVVRIAGAILKQHSQMTRDRRER